MGLRAQNRFQSEAQDNLLGKNVLNIADDLIIISSYDLSGLQGSVTVWFQNDARFLIAHARETRSHEYRRRGGPFP
jgi:hypothetical protein